MGGSSDVFRQIADSLPQMVWSLAADGRIEWLNRRFIEYTGSDATNEFATDDAHIAAFVHPDDHQRLSDEWRAAFAKGEAYRYEFRLKSAAGTYRWFLAHATPFRNEAGTIERWYGVSTEIHDRRRTADMLAFLAEASDVLSSTRDVGVALELAAGLAVPRIADWCAVYLREATGFFRPAAIHHADPAQVALARELVRRYPFSIESQRHLIDTRQPLFMPAISPEMIQAGATDERHASLLHQLDIASAIVVPLVVDDEVTGMLHLVRGQTNEAFVRSDVDFAQVLAKRIAVAIDNAVVYERERNVASTFQNAALPQALPVVDGLALHRAYRAGDRGVTVGGDWYDAVRLRDGSLLFSIGDVAGKGLHAAVLMASMRQAIRVAGLQGLAPGAVLDAANASLAAEHSGRFVTAFVGRLDVATGRLDYASAGHPAPLVRDDRGVHALAFGDPPLGVWDGAYTTSTLVLQTPWLLVAYTDGLIERTGDVLEGEALLRTVAADDGIVHTADPAAYLQARLLRGAVRDDTAILTLRADGSAHWRFGASDALRAESTRHRLRAWLAEHTHVDCAAAELIYGELVGNVVRHSPGGIDVDVACNGDRIRLFVQSDGPSFELRACLPESLLSECGRGLFIVNTLGSGLAATQLPVFGNQISVDLPLALSETALAT
jgi:PAS domain S-box-containing protein